MTFKILIVVLVLSLTLFSTVKAQTIDTVKHTERIIQTDTTISTSTHSSTADDDFSPGMFFFALIGIGLVFICIGIGVVLAAVGLLVVMGLISMGILSTSVIVGLNKKSFTKGFKTFFLLSGSIGGLGIGIGVLYLINKFFKIHLTTQSSVFIGGGSGLLGGILLGLLAYTMLIKLASYFKQRLRIDA